jgi:glyoxylase-like metal-dependent hydrolase (beta-lactamase superfamily II)
MTARFHLLHAGYVGDRVASTVSHVADGDRHIVIDPGMVASPERILGPLATAGCAPDEVTDVVLSHWHPDHTWHIALFPNARVHDHWATYRNDLWTSRPAEGAEVSPAVTLIETPGHTAQDVSTVIRTDDGVVVCTHLWWTPEGPRIDPRATDQEALDRNRERVLEIADIVVPGHGPPFTP